MIRTQSVLDLVLPERLPGHSQIVAVCGHIGMVLTMGLEIDGQGLLEVVLGGPIVAEYPGQLTRTRAIAAIVRCQPYDPSSVLVGRPIADLVLSNLAALIGYLGSSRSISLSSQDSGLDSSLDLGLNPGEEAIRSALVALGQGSAGLIQEGLRDLATDSFQLGDALFQLSNIGLVAGSGIRQPALDLRLLDF